MSFIRIDGDVLSGRCLAPVYVGHPVNYAHGMHLTALLDTGATDSAITEFVARALGLPIIGQAALHAPHAGQVTINRYAAQLEFWKYGIEIGEAAHVARNAPLVSYVQPMSGIQLLIGMDILGRAQSFQIDGDRWTLSW